MPPRRSIWWRRAFGGAGDRRGRRDRAVDHGASLQHRALAFPPRAPRRGAQMGAGRRRRQFPARRVREAARPAHQDGRHHPHVECARHDHAGQGDHPHRHARGIPVLVDGSQAAVHLRSTCRTWMPISMSSPATRPMGRPASACFTARPSISQRMPPYQGGGEMIGEVTLDDVTYADPPHRFEAGTPAIVAGDRPRRGPRLHEAVGRDRIAAHEARLLDHAHGSGCRRSTGCASSARRRDKGAIVSFNIEGAHAHDIATVHRPRRASRSAPAPIAPSRCCADSASPPPAAPPSPCTTPTKRLTRLAEALDLWPEVFI